MAVQMQGFMNIYRSGWFHRAGKPGNIDRHAGDIYLTKMKALENIDPPSHYIATVEVTWWDYEKLAENGEDSDPIPLSKSRKMHASNYQVGA